jgi:hypothetical protein
MKVAIMQPYLLPYLGYFQLIHAVDVFVIYDDVNYIKQGWINRNYILANGQRQRITLPLLGASSNRLINQIRTGRRDKVLKSLQQSYSKAPCFDSVYPIILDIFSRPEENLGFFLDYQLRRLSEYLALKPKWLMSSGLHKNIRLLGQDKVLAICRELGATHYINLPGGEGLYDRDVFTKEGLRISFLRPRQVEYSQGSSDPFEPNLSIIDVMMFNDSAKCAKFMKEYDLD